MEKVWLKLCREVLTQHPYGARWQELKALITRWFDKHREGSAELLHSVGLLPSEDSFVNVHYRALSVICETRTLRNLPVQSSREYREATGTPIRAVR
jgi:hypothetical protein